MVATTLALMAADFERYASDPGQLGASFDRLPLRLVVEVLRHDRCQAPWEQISHWLKRYLKQHRDQPGFSSASFEAPLYI